MRIAILGAGRVGRALGAGWAQGGHDVTFGVRDPAGAPPQALPAGSRADTIAAACAGATVVVLAVPGGAVPAVLDAAGALSGVIVIDVTNPFHGGAAAEAGAPSLAERIAALRPAARVVKAFNTVGCNVLRAPRFGALSAATFVCADDAAARSTVLELAAALGLEAVNAGPLRNARLLEALATLGAQIAGSGHGDEIAFGVLRRPTAATVAPSTLRG